MASRRVILRAELNAAAKTVLERICEDRGMTQLSVMSRLAIWFAELEPEYQAQILRGDNPRLPQELTARLIEQLKRSQKK
jgi:hypothetical protein